MPGALGDRRATTSRRRSRLLLALFIATLGTAGVVGGMPIAVDLFGYEAVVTRVDAEGTRSAIEKKRLPWLPGVDVRYVVVDASGVRHTMPVEEPLPDEGDRGCERWITARANAEE